MSLFKQWIHISACCTTLLFFSGCGQLDRSSTSQQATVIPTPTISPLFLKPSPVAPTPVVAKPSAIPTSLPTAVASAVVESTVVTEPTVVPSDSIAEVPIYTDELVKNWSLADSQNVRFNIKNNDVVHQGKQAIKAQPVSGTGTLQFSVRKSTAKPYLRDQVLGVSFWLSGGSSAVAPEDLAVTVLGSDKYPYWVANDTSVKPNPKLSSDWPLFSETRLYFLGFTQSIRPNEWAEVVLWLDEREFDPSYTYVTGIYIKNDDRRSQPFYIDDVQLLVKKDAASGG